jgi:hypothetical protein
MTNDFPESGLNAPGSLTHLKEVAIDHANGIFAHTNSYIADIGGPPADDSRGIRQQES